MRESIKVKKPKKIRPWFCGIVIFISCVLSFLCVMSLVSFKDEQKFNQKYFEKTEKVKYQILKNVEDRDGKTYFLLRNIRTGKKVFKECDFKDYNLFRPGDKIYYNLTKRDLEEQGEYKVPDENNWSWVSICFVVSLFILGIIPNLVTESEGKDELTMTNILLVFNILVIGISMIELLMV